MTLLSRFKLGAVIALLVTVAGCNDISLAPTSEFTEENYWTSADKAKLVLNTAYQSMSNSTYFFYNAGLSDNAFVGRGDPANVSSIARGNFNPSTPRFSNQWDMHYNGIKTVHNFLANVDRVSGMSESLRARMKAEARFIRARHYFQLTTWFGAVPFFTEDISIEESQNIGETSHADIIDFVHSELSAIAEDLPKNYSGENQGRITRGAALALNARVYLFDNDWQGVVNNTEPLMANFSYSLFPSYRGLFLPSNEFNQEVILSTQYVPSEVPHSVMFDLAPLSAGARVNAMAPTQELVDSYLTMNGRRISNPNASYDEDNPFDNRDPRLDATIFRHLSQLQDTDGTTHPVYTKPGTAPNQDLARDEYQGQGSNSTATGYYQKKYYDPTVPQNFESGLNLIQIRYADVLLMHAEAKNELGEMNAQVWSNTIRPIRERAGLNSSALSFDGSWGQQRLRQIIRRERRVELALEGLRIFDLRRWETAEEVLNGPVHGAPYGEPTDEVGTILANRSFDPSSDYLWPIPQSELDLNDNLDQNPGY